MSWAVNRIVVTANRPLSPVVNLVLSIDGPPKFLCRLIEIRLSRHGKVLEMPAHVASWRLTH